LELEICLNAHVTLAADRGGDCLVEKKLADMRAPDGDPCGSQFRRLL
jgi:hypothetical protein